MLIFSVEDNEEGFQGFAAEDITAATENVNKLLMEYFDSCK